MSALVSYSRLRYIRDKCRSRLQIYKICYEFLQYKQQRLNYWIDILSDFRNHRNEGSTMLFMQIVYMKYC